MLPKAKLYLEKCIELLAKPPKRKAVRSPTADGSLLGKARKGRKKVNEDASQKSVKRFY